MKQHITTNQLSELSDQSKDKLRKWWKPKEGDYIKYVNSDSTTIVYAWYPEFEAITCELDIEESSAHKDKKDFYPLLSIGQMIEFIHDHTKTYEDCVKFGAIAELYIRREFKKNDDGTDFTILGWSAPIIRGSHFSSELVDALWEAVKQILERENAQLDSTKN